MAAGPIVHQSNARGGQCRGPMVMAVHGTVVAIWPSLFVGSETLRGAVVATMRRRGRQGASCACPHRLPTEARLSAVSPSRHVAQS